MPQYIEQLAQQMGTNAVNGIFGMVLGDYNDRRQLRQQERLQQMQIAGNKEMMDYSMMKQLEMWNNTNYKAQLEHMKAAGLSPGLMYGMKGGGGTTVGSPSGNVSGGQAPVGGREIMDAVGMGLNIELMKAQKEMLLSQAEKNKAEAAKTAGVDTKEAETRILDLTQGIENKKTQQALNEVQKRISEIQENIQSRTQEDAVRAIGWNAEKIMQEMEDLRYRNLINEETWRAKVEIVQTELAGLYIKNDLMRSEIKVNDQQIQSMATKIVQEWRELEIKHKDADTRQKQQALNEWVNDVQNSTKLTAETIGNIIGGVLRKGKGSKTYREGERNGKPYSEYSETTPF